ncbi:hypothetical protein B0A48_18313 [Cryoendolithus antarcticus]|uniref:Uncharacterized protein n=1 Tax=Cryoendolithus antarcticus TaxID=1507870 RepID=A0A1V8S8Q9_9PEZI|nr:hypothetical protein B0A48_18313 [Cryoendolithus antarcticus]
MTADDMAKLQEEAIDYASPIIVRVGAERHPFIINKDVSTRSLDYFRTALKNC